CCGCLARWRDGRGSGSSTANRSGPRSWPRGCAKSASPMWPRRNAATRRRCNPSLLDVVAEQELLVADVEPAVGGGRVCPHAAAGGSLLRLFRQLQASLLLPPSRTRFNQRDRSALLGGAVEPAVGEGDRAAGERPRVRPHPLPGLELLAHPAA